MYNDNILNISLWSTGGLYIISKSEQLYDIFNFI